MWFQYTLFKVNVVSNGPNEQMPPEMIFSCGVSAESTDLESNHEETPEKPNRGNTI